MMKPSAACNRTTNRSGCNAALRKRGSLLIRLDKEMTWLAPHDGSPGHPAVSRCRDAAMPRCRDAAIQFCLTIEVLFKLQLRQTGGMVASLLQLAGLDWPVPDCSTRCRRQNTLAVRIPYRRAVAFTSGDDGDSPVLPGLPAQIPEGEQSGTMTADEACDTRRDHTAIIEREAMAIIPVRKNGHPWKEDCPAARARNETLRATRHRGRAFCKRWTGYLPAAGSKRR